ncbi:MAG: hypothetical protein KatS3mg118_2289 [Paracoccaceae bacterium]|nr:MAG: hypothetical protein D6686_04205 [Alphaproteobacteria bacterium]GIX14330.1 MAG: hypothetical protein KatS3mg118_2289 [Paracoccaceae bacterium]
MAEIRCETPFGPVALSSATGTPGLVETVAVALPEGLALDRCQRATLHVALGSGEAATLSLACHPAPGMRVRPAVADGLAAWTVEGPGLAGAFAMPDAAWLSARHGLSATGFSAAHAGISLELRAAGPVVATIPFAVAWARLAPGSEEEFGPFFAVQKALAQGAG